MEIAMIGLGRMGGNMTRRLLKGGCRVVVYDPVKEARDILAREGAVPAATVDELVAKLAVPPVARTGGEPRTVWLMVPAGKPVEDTVGSLATLLSPGDTVIDGGNSNYKDSVRRAAMLAKKRLVFLDVGVSGGIWGLKEGYCLMVGGDIRAFRRLEPLFQTLAPSPQTGYGHVGPSGAGHFVKMIHNGIEYGLMEAYAEGFEMMCAKQEFNLDLARVAEIWRHGSVVRSWMLDLAAAALKEDARLDKIMARVEDSGEGRWMVQESVDLAIPVPVITLALQARFRSRQEQPFGGRLLAVLRKQFGGHTVERK